MGYDNYKKSSDEVIKILVDAYMLHEDIPEDGRDDVTRDIKEDISSSDSELSDVYQLILPIIENKNKVIEELEEKVRRLSKATL